jgi:arylsulfatase A-like enzyme
MADQRPVAVSIAVGLTAGFAGLLVVSVWEALAVGAGFGAALFAVAGLFAAIALGLGAALGVVAHGWRAQFGERPLSRLWRRLRADDQAEAAGVGAVFAAAAVAAMVAAVVFAGSLKLVAGVERKGVGALLCAAVVAAALPFIAAAAVPIYRAGARLAFLVPRVGPLPRPVVLAGGGVLVGVIATFAMIESRLDWRALPLGLPIALALLAIIIIVAHAVISRRADSDRGRRIIGVAGGASLLFGAALMLFALDPGPETARAIAERGRGAPALIAVGRSLSDGDRDGVSAFFAGPDCDDSNPDVHPGAREIPGNGIDDNCLGGDRALAAADPENPETPAAGAAPTPSLPAAKNLLLVVIDTLRADRLGAAGYRRDNESLTPNLDKLIERSTYFTRVWAQAPNTPRSFPSMFTSRFPSQVAVDKRFSNYSNVLSENVSVFEVLAGAGIDTIGFSSHFYFSEERGIRQGFAAYNNDGAKNIAGSNKDIASPRTVPLATARLAELGASGERFAMFVHLFEPHSSYLAHDEWPITERGTDSLVQRYDYEIKFVDRWVGKLLDGLADAGLADDTVVVIASDHGEAFGVHRFAGRRMFFHGQTLYDELLRVPLIVSMPGAEPRRVDEPVMLVDLAPTMAAAMGVAAPGSFIGQSLWPAVHGKEIARKRVYAQLIPAPSWNYEAVMMVAANGADKIIYRVSEGAWELYNLATDPEERIDRSRGDTAKFSEMKDALGRFLEVELVQ